MDEQEQQERNELVATFKNGFFEETEFKRLGGEPRDDFEFDGSDNGFKIEITNLIYSGERAEDTPIPEALENAHKEVYEEGFGYKLGNLRTGRDYIEVADELINGKDGEVEIELVPE